MTVIVYSTNACPYCVIAKNWLKDHNIAFTEKNVQEDHEAAEEMIKKSGQRGVPIIDVNGKIIKGFNPIELRKALGIKD